MRRWFCLACVMLCCGELRAAPDVPTAGRGPAAESKKTPGVEAAQALSTLTGVAISPLLGVGAVGAWRYFHAPVGDRARLPWFAQPWFWVPALLLVLMVAVKDTIGPGVPTLLKKPLDLAELFENKISGLIALGIFVPLVASIFHAADEGSRSSDWGLAVISLAPLGNLLAVPLAMLAFIVVFLAGHAVHVLILISPFATLDAALKLFRFLLVSSVAVTSLLNPYAGALWALVIVVISYFIAGWSLRMMVFGSVFAWDLATFRHKRFRLDPAAAWAFTARKIQGAPARSYGKLTPDAQGRLQLRYRPWLVLPPRMLALPAGPQFVGRGLFYPEIRSAEGETWQAQLTLPPRYRTHEEEVARLCGLGPVQDIGLRRGLKEAWRWLRSRFGAREPLPPPIGVPAAG